MKLTPSPSPFTLAIFEGGALPNKRQIYLSIVCLLMAAYWNTNSVLAAPAKLDSLDATFPLDLQPPIFEASAASQNNGENDATATTIDSYGNPIESIQPIETPDGRKVVSAQGLQFEIPNYASGITEIKKPADDLLPPFVASFENAVTLPTTASATAVDEKKVPLSADRESFPPFKNTITGSSTLPSKTTFIKSEDGKVITNNIFLSGGLGSSALENDQQKNALASSTQSFTKTSTSSSAFAATTSAAATGFVTNNADTSSSFGSKYTGRFGGPPGILAPQNNNGFTTASTTVTKTYNNKPAAVATSSGLATGSSVNHKYTGRFGGPPGILKPYDNVKNG